MDLTTNNLLYALATGKIITFGTNGNGRNGPGFHRSIPVPLSSLMSGTSPATLVALETNALGVQFASGTGGVSLTVQTTLPLDYDPNYDKLELIVWANSAGTTNAPIFTATGYRKRAGAALATISSITSSSAVPISTASAGETIIVASGKGLLPGDNLMLNFGPATHSTDAVNVYGIELRIRSTLIASNSSYL